MRGQTARFLRRKAYALAVNATGPQYIQQTRQGIAAARFGKVQHVVEGAKTLFQALWPTDDKNRIVSGTIRNNPQSQRAIYQGLKRKHLFRKRRKVMKIT